MYEDGLCSCGAPVVLAHHPDNDGWYDAHKTQCHRCAAQERAVRGNGKDPYEPAPGEKVYATYNAEGKQRSDARKAAAQGPIAAQITE